LQGRREESLRMSSSKSSRIRHHRMVLYWLLSLLVLTLVLPLIPYAIAEIDPFAGQVANPGAELWRDVRQRDGSVAGSTQVKGVDTGILINTWGEDWRKFRMQQLIPYGAALMGIVLAIILLYYLVHGPLRTHGERDDRKIQRFSVYERTTHWFTVGIFWLLGLTGLILLYGRYVLTPLLGPEGFAVTASACKEAHNLFGPLFLVAILMMFMVFVKDNLYARGDMTWLLKGGGMLGGGHVSAGEEVLAALKRETEEELGFTPKKVQALYSYVMRNSYESELIYTFRTTSNGPFRINTDEIMFGKFWRLADIENNLGKNIFTPNFEQEFTLLKKTLNQPRAH